MPKSLDKKNTKKGPSSENSRSKRKSKENETAISKSRKRKPAEEIAKSKQLAGNIKKTRSSRNSNKPTESRICGNGKPMPSLAELEEMFEYSDDDGQPSTTTKTSPPIRCQTPEQKPIVIEDKLFSPRTLKQIATKMMDMISPPTLTIEDDSPPAVIPQKRRKKTGIPYIVGCKDRPQVPWQPKTKFGVGDTDYGTEDGDISDENECSPKRRRKRSQKLNISKSIFNAKSDEIAARLKESNGASSGSGSPDSNKTISYDYACNSPIQNTIRSFSPLPSTSRDMDTFLKNEQRLNESLQSENLCDDSLQNDVEVVEVPCETIILDDTTMPEINKSQENYQDDDCCIIIDSDNNTRQDSPLKIDSTADDIYGSLDLNQNYSNDDICEVINVDEVIAENKAIIEKYKENKNDSVILVDPNASFLPKSNKSEKEVHTPPSSIHHGTSGNIPKRTQSSNVIEVNNNQHICKASQRMVNNIAGIVKNFFNNIAPSSSDDVNLARIQNQLNSFSDDDVKIIETLHDFSQIILDIPSSELCDSYTPRPILANDVHIITNTTSPAPTNRATQNNQRSKKNAQANKPETANKSMISDLSPENTGSRNIGDCPICMDNLTNCSVASTLCGHVFCMNCIKVSLRTNGKKCPTCRKPLKGVGYHQIFL